MNHLARFLTLSPAIALGLILLSLSFTALSQSSKNDELSEIVPAVDDLLPDPDKPNNLPEEAIAAILISDDVTLYVVSESERTEGPIPGYLVLGKARITKKDTAAIIEDVKKSLAAENGVAMCGLCFHAHHVLRAQSRGHTYDLMICYPCSQVLTYGKDATSERRFLSANWLNGSPDVLKRVAKSYGLPKPQVFIDEELNVQYAARAYANWFNSMPQSFRPFFPPTQDPDGNSTSPNVNTLREALAKQYPDAKRRILALFAWYGSVPWGESVERSADDLLRDYSFRDLWSEAQSPRLSHAQLEGAARSFASKYFSSREEHTRRELQDGLRKYSEERAHWLQIMPASIRPLWKDEMWRYQLDFGDTATEQIFRANEQPMLLAFAQEFPEKNQQILILLDWYGSALEEKSFGRYQAVVDHLLQTFTTSEIAQALVSTTLTERQLDGATRLFAEDDFRRGRREEIRILPSSLKTLLFAHTKKGPNEEKFKRMFAPPVPTPGDGVLHAFVEPILPGDENVAFVTVEETNAEPQFAPLMVRGNPIDERFNGYLPTSDDGRPCINTGKARYIINKHDVLLFEIRADCGSTMRGYGYVICRINGERRCSEAPDWYFAGRSYELANEGIQVNGAATHSWNDPIETPNRLQAMAARINQNNDHPSPRHASHDRSLLCRTLDPPNLTNSFPCSGREDLDRCKGFPSLDDIRDGDVIDMNSPVGRWVTQYSKDSDSPHWACWVETH